MDENLNVNEIEHDVAVAMGNDEEQEKQIECGPVKYQPRTFRASSVNSQRRRAILPAYALAKNDSRPALLLLTNVHDVDRQEMERQSYYGGLCPFEFKQHGHVEPVHSFMVGFFEDTFVEPARRWNIDYSIIDYNSSRLRKCMEQYTRQTGQPALLLFDEFPMALEFFLQIDGI